MPEGDPGALGALAQPGARGRQPAAWGLSCAQPSRARAHPPAGRPRPGSGAGGGLGDLAQETTFSHRLYPLPEAVTESIQHPPQAEEPPRDASAFPTESASDPATLPPPSAEGKPRGGEVAMPGARHRVLVCQLPLH